MDRRDATPITSKEPKVPGELEPKKGEKTSVRKERWSGKPASKQAKKSLWVSSFRTGIEGHM